MNQNLIMKRNTAKILLMILFAVTVSSRASSQQIPNMSFDNWVMVNKTWYPDSDITSNFWWDSGNKGANTVGHNNPTSPEDAFVVKGRAVRMETVSVDGIMAGGNIYTGEFKEVTLFPKPGAKVDFGRPFEGRPEKLQGYYCYAPKTIDKAEPPYRNMLGRPDRCRIYILLLDTDAPCEVNISEHKTLPAFNDPSVVGYAALTDSTGTGGKYREFSLDIKYNDSRTPKFCAIVASASAHADYFTGGVGSLLYLDEFIFIY